MTCAPRDALEPMLGRPVTRQEARAIVTEPKCSTCLRTREQLGQMPGQPRLQCCPDCFWGWACDEHRGAYMAGPHKEVNACVWGKPQRAAAQAACRRLRKHAAHSEM